MTDVQIDRHRGFLHRDVSLSLLSLLRLSNRPAPAPAPHRRSPVWLWPELDARARSFGMARRSGGSSATTRRSSWTDASTWTILASQTLPITVHHYKASRPSFVGFFEPESALHVVVRYHVIFFGIHLARDQRHDEREPGRADTYIVSWNDHFFVLKVESNLITSTCPAGGCTRESFLSKFMVSFLSI